MHFLTEKHLSRKLPRAGQEITLFVLPTDYRISSAQMVGPLRDAITKDKWDFEDAAHAAWEGATVTIRPPTPDELSWALEEFKRIVKEYEQT